MSEQHLQKHCSNETGVAFTFEDAPLAVVAKKETTRPPSFRRIGSGSFGEVYQCNVTCSPYGGDVSMKLGLEYGTSHVPILIRIFVSNKILTPPAQAADITGLLSYLRPFGIVPLPPFPSKIFAPLSLLRSIPPFPLSLFPPETPRPFPPPEIFSLSSLRSFPPFPC